MTGRDNKRGRGVGDLSGQRLSPIARELNSEREPVGEGQRFPKAIAGDTFASGPPVKQFSRGRTCAVDGCETRLSIYNPADTCAEHPYTKMVMQTRKVIRTDAKKVRKSNSKKTTIKGR